MIRNAILIFTALAMIVPPAEAMVAPDRVFEVDVSLVSCAVCRKKIKEILMAIENVKEVEFDLVNKKALVTMKGNADLKKDVLAKAFEPSKYIFNGVVEKKVTESKPTPKTP